MRTGLCGKCGERYVSVAVWMPLEDAKALLNGEKIVPDVEEYVHWDAEDENRVARTPEELLCYCDNCGITEILPLEFPEAA